MNEPLRTHVGPGFLHGSEQYAATWHERIPAGSTIQSGDLAASVRLARDEFAPPFASFFFFLATYA